MQCEVVRLGAIVLSLIAAACAQGGSASAAAAGAGGEGPAASATASSSSTAGATTASSAGSGGSGGSAGAGGSGGSSVDAGMDAGPPPPELVLWYRFEDAAQPQILDSSIYGNHGTPSPGVQRGVSGRFGAGVRFDGDKSQIVAPYSASLDITGPITIEAWAYFETPISSNRMLVRKYLQYQMSVSVVPVPDLLEFYSQPLGFARADNPVEFQRWIYLAASHDGVTARLYYDGVLVAEKPLAGMKPSNSQPLWLGGDGVNPMTAPDGGMDEVKIWNVVRTEQEVCTDGQGVWDATMTPPCKI